VPNTARGGKRGLIEALSAALRLDFESDVLSKQRFASDTPIFSWDEVNSHAAPRNEFSRTRAGGSWTEVGRMTRRWPALTFMSPSSLYRCLTDRGTQQHPKGNHAKSDRRTAHGSRDRCEYAPDHHRFRSRVVRTALAVKGRCDAWQSCCECPGGSGVGDQSPRGPRSI